MIGDDIVVGIFELKYKKLFFYFFLGETWIVDDNKVEFCIVVNFYLSIGLSKL